MKVAVLGCGGMGRTVIQHLREDPSVKQIVGFDVSDEPLQTLGKSHPVQTTRRLDDILRDSQIKLAFVTASNDAHKMLAMQCLEAGKAVLCEKPAATTLQDAEEMVVYSEKRGLFLQIGFELRYSTLYTKVKDWIEAGLLGQVVNTHCYYICNEFHQKGSWRNRKSTGGGMFGEKLSHYVDLPRWWIGSQVKDVISICAPNVIPYYEVRDNYHTIYRFANGAVSELTFMMAPAATFTGDPLADEIDRHKGDGHALRFLIVGTAGAAETSVFDRTLKRWEFGDSPQSFTSRWVEDLSWSPKEDHSYFHNTRDQTHDVVRRVAAGMPPKTPARDAYETMKLCFAAEQSADSGATVELANM